MSNKPKPDDRRDNVKKIQNNIDNTIQNYRLAQDMMAVTDDEKTKRDLEEKNKRRLESLKGMKEEIRDEALHAKRNNTEF
ncbi:MAG: small acid-soluble spore protein Tlp [Tissierellaceae bacterium]|nr:small acid-soluble spore protein Tlp [Tissierellaceae bacterium]